MTIQELKPILITLLGESSRISWNEATDQAASAIMELVDKEKIEFAEWFKNNYIKIEVSGITTRVFYKDKKTGYHYYLHELPAIHRKQLAANFSQSKTAKK